MFCFCLIVNIIPQEFENLTCAAYFRGMSIGIDFSKRHDSILQMGSMRLIFCIENLVFFEYYEIRKMLILCFDRYPNFVSSINKCIIRYCQWICGFIWSVRMYNVSNTKRTRRKKESEK